MKITKFVHSCLLVEMPEPVNRTVLFDPGMMSAGSLDIDKLVYLDDIVITHVHGDHCDPKLIKRLVEKFPDVRITGTSEVAEKLAKEAITVSTEVPEGMEFFDSPHESVAPLYPLPEQIGVHYLDKLSDPGDGHSFNETKAVLAMPMTAPWGSIIKAVNIVLELKPKHVIPIHDWHWRDEARQGTYADIEKIFAEKGITFHNLKDGEPVVIDV